MLRFVETGDVVVVVVVVVVILVDRGYVSVNAVIM